MSSGCLRVFQLKPHRQETHLHSCQMDLDFFLLLFLLHFLLPAAHFALTPAFVWQFCALQRGTARQGSEASPPPPHTYTRIHELTAELAFYCPRHHFQDAGSPSRCCAPAAPLIISSSGSSAAHTNAASPPPDGGDARPSLLLRPAHSKGVRVRAWSKYLSSFIMGMEFDTLFYFKKVVLEEQMAEFS